MKTLHNNSETTETTFDPSPKEDRQEQQSLKSAPTGTSVPGFPGIWID